MKLKDTQSAVNSELIDFLTQLKNFQFMKKLVVVSKEIESKDKGKYDNFYLNARAEIIIN